MAEQLNFSDEHNNNEYYCYKKHEESALQILIPAKATETWSVADIYRAAEQAVPLLSKEQLSTVVDHLQKSIRSRKSFSLRFRFAPKQKRTGHDYWAAMIGRLIKLAGPEAAVVVAHDQRRLGKLTSTGSFVAPQIPTLDVFEDGKQCLGDHPAEQEQFEEPEEANISAAEAIFLRFLEDIELCVAQAEALWKRVVAGEMYLATASMRLYSLPRVETRT
jgi:hypothetical protein